MPTDASRLREAKKQIDIVGSNQPAARQAELDEAAGILAELLASMEDEPKVRTDGGLAITAEELRKRKFAPSSTPDEDRPVCPQCGSPKLRHQNDKWGTANGRWYCDECMEHVKPEGKA